MRDETLLEQLQHRLDWRRIGNTTATIAGIDNTLDTILIVRDRRHAETLMYDYKGEKRDGEIWIGNLVVKTIFDIPDLHGYKMPVIVDHHALSQLITQHTAALNKYWREKMEADKPLSLHGEDALRALHMRSDKKLNEMVEWIALDTFRMRKTVDTGSGLDITVKTFQIKEVHDETE